MRPNKELPMRADTQLLIEQFPIRVQTLALAARRFLLDTLPDVAEIPDPNAKVIGYGYGAGYKDMVCTLLLSQKSVKIGFYKGAELPDPHKLLTGKGKVHRYVELQGEEQLQAPVLLELVHRAYEAWQARRG